MRAAAGTDVVVDILFFQKRGPDEPAKPASWIDLAEVLPPQDAEEAISINRTFVEHPDMVLGSHARTSSAFGPTYTCLPVRPVQDALFQDLLAAVHTLPADIYVAPAPPKPERETLTDETIRVGTAAEGATINEGSYLVVKGRLAQIIDRMAVAIPIRDGKGSDGIPARHARIIRGLVQIRDAVRDVLRAQEADLPWGGAQVRLRAAYAHFKREFGPINLTTISETIGPDGESHEAVRRPNLQPFLDDPDVWLVSSIEDYDAETGVARQGPIFTERVLHPPVTPEVANAGDALAVALHETGAVDLDRVAELVGVTREAAIAELGNRIFLDPEAWRAGLETWWTADAYLSGPVRRKLEIALDAAFEDPRFERNVEALKETLPEDLKPSEITARLGAPWIPADVVAAFCEEVLGVATRVYHTVEIASWTVEVNAFLRNLASTTD
jgi:N12 class adenine-specific DNA methylase